MFDADNMARMPVSSVGFQQATLRDDNDMLVDQIAAALRAAERAGRDGVEASAATARSRASEWRAIHRFPGDHPHNMQAEGMRIADLIDTLTTPAPAGDG